MFGREWSNEKYIVISLSIQEKEQERDLYRD
jgi:hypothetical protein